MTTQPHLSYFGSLSPFATVIAVKWLRSCPNLLHLSLFSYHLHQFCTHNVTTYFTLCLSQFITVLPSADWRCDWIFHTCRTLLSFICTYAVVLWRTYLSLVSHTRLVVVLSHPLLSCSWHLARICHALLPFKLSFEFVCASNVTFVTLCCRLVAIMWWFYFHHTYRICHMAAYPPSVCGAVHSKSRKSDNKNRQHMSCRLSTLF